MFYLLRSLFILIVSVLVVCCNYAYAEPYQAPHVEVELVSDVAAIVPGNSHYLALRFKPEKDWHIYWKYHGDSGMAPQVRWNKPDNVTLGNIEWPIPKRIAVSHLMNYGYDKEVFLPVRITTDSTISSRKEVTISSSVSWLVCQEECIPGSAELEITLPVGKVVQPSKFAPALADTIDNVPLKLDLVEITARPSGKDDIVLEIINHGQLTLPESDLYFIPDQSGQIENAAPQTVTKTFNGVALVLKKSRSHPIPEELSGILVSEQGFTNSKHKALEIKIPIAGEITHELNNLTKQQNNISLPLTILFALLGGILLNLMPCVFPILSIKILGFVQQGKQNRSGTLSHALSFAAGVVISFWILVALLLLIRSAGTAIGWGFQLQSPLFVMTMIFLMYTIGLNLIGFFDFGSSLQNLAGRQSEKHGLTGSFFSGVLATALATPCTAPFMATALGVALSQPIYIAFIIFTALAIGMALPYVVIASSPKLLALLPKPGMWMEQLKQLLAFPLFATAIWLISVFTSQTTPTKAIALLFAILAFTFAIWLWKSFAARSVTYIFAPALLLGSIYYAWPTSNSAAELNWEPYSNQYLNELLAQNKPVFIDFTAEWCLTCKLNKYTVLSSSSVINELKKRQVVLLQADWTNLDQEITKAIESYNRSGVPLNVLYYGDGTRHHVFPSLLTRSQVIEELERVRVR